MRRQCPAFQSARTVPRLRRSCRASIRNDSYGVHLYQPFRPAQRRDDDPGRDRKHPFEVPADNTIDSFPVTWVDDVYRDLANVLERRARLLEQHLDVLHGLVGLSCHVADSNALRSLEVLADLPAHEYHRALSNDHLAQVIVEPLLGVSVLGIELAYSLVCHLGPFGSGFKAVGLAARIERGDAEIYRACIGFAVVDDWLRLSHSGAACIVTGDFAPHLLAGKHCDRPYSCAGL